MGGGGFSISEQTGSGSGHPDFQGRAHLRVYIRKLSAKIKVRDRRAA